MLDVHSKIKYITVKKLDKSEGMSTKNNMKDQMLDGREFGKPVYPNN